MGIILSAHNLCKSYSNGKVMQHVLKNLEIRIQEGDFTVIMGNSGSGKSTLLYALSGMDKPSLGSIRFKDVEIANYSYDQLALFRRDNCGFVFQQVYLNDMMSVMDNILVCGLLVKKEKKELVKRAKDLLRLVGLEEDTYHKFPSQLSGGQAQRVAIVRAIINQPDVLFADEPTGALNSSNSDKVLDVITKLNETGQSIVMVTHDIKSARRANRVLYLRDGVIEDELVLGKYGIEEEERQQKLHEFLERMGW